MNKTLEEIIKNVTTQDNMMLHGVFVIVNIPKLKSDLEELLKEVYVQGCKLGKGRGEMHFTTEPETYWNLNKRQFLGGKK